MWDCDFFCGEIAIGGRTFQGIVRSVPDYNVIFDLIADFKVTSRWTKGMTAAAVFDREEKYVVRIVFNAVRVIKCEKDVGNIRTSYLHNNNRRRRPDAGVLTTV